MTLQDFTTELQLTLDENLTLKQKIERYEVYFKKLLLDNGGTLEVKPFKDKEERLKLSDYNIAFGITTIELI